MVSSIIPGCQGGSIVSIHSSHHYDLGLMGSIPARGICGVSYQSISTILQEFFSRLSSFPLFSKLTNS